MDLQDISDRFNQFIINRTNDPVWEYENVNIYIASSFVNSYTKQYNKLKSEIDQLWKCFRNASYGLDDKKPFSRSGSDGVFLISPGSKKYNNKMTQTVVQYMSDWKSNHFVKEFDFLNENPIPVRVVAHPGKFRIRPIGFLSKTDGIQKLVLTDIVIEPK